MQAANGRLNSDVVDLLVHAPADGDTAGSPTVGPAPEASLAHGAARARTPPEEAVYADELAEALEEAVAERQSPTDPQPADRFLDRELSWLDFNARVLGLASDPTVPLLERARFLAIYASNLDEFFMVRVAALRDAIDAGITAPRIGGHSPQTQLDAICARAHALLEDSERAFTADVRPALAAVGIEILRWTELTGDERRLGSELFRERIHPVLTPLAVDPAHPFPYISGLSLNLAVIVRERTGGRERFAWIKVPPPLPRFLPVGESRYVQVEDVIAAHLAEVFPGHDVVESRAFRVTRNSDVSVEENVDNLLHALERELSRRRLGVAVRLEVEGDMSPRVLELLVRELGVRPEDVYRLVSPLDLTGLWAVADRERAELRYPPVTGGTPTALRPREGTSHSDIFAALAEGDVLVHHPYDSFATTVQAFLEQAAFDPHVLAIKQTLYRTSGDSAIVEALIDAAQAGKQVLVLVELKARFDERANIRWARKLEQAGCHVVYGLVGLKTHCKLSLVVRVDADGELRRYAHIGTGNYNPNTARSYEDVGLLTASPQITADIADLFNHLSGYTRPQSYRSLLVAPDTLRSGIVALIGREIGHARAGRRAGITIKMNSLTDAELIDELYRAAREGVAVDVVVRGMCSLRPGVPGLSEHIRVRSVLGRFLEHSRVLRFANGGDHEVWFGSADFMRRNLDRRVEVLLRVDDPSAREQLEAVLDLATADQVRAWELQSDGSWTAPTVGRGAELVDLQEALLARHGLSSEPAGRPG